MSDGLPPLRNPAVLLSTWFGVGLLPKAPGTWGSLVALPLGWALDAAGGWPALAGGIVLVSLAGWWASEQTLALVRTEDPGYIVIDEVVGQWLVLLPVPRTALFYFAAFVLFRIFDIAKPWPVSWADRQVKGGLGVMLDDLLAGAYGLILLALVREFWKA